jgi:hypothetical protein
MGLSLHVPGNMQSSLWRFYGLYEGFWQYARRG